MVQDMGEHVGMTSSSIFFQQVSFKPSKADPDIWMRSSKDGTHYEYIVVYVDALAICKKDPWAFCDTLKGNNKQKISLTPSKQNIYLKSKEMANLLIILVMHFFEDPGGTFVS